jgi:serine/threonine-protein kinase
MSSLAPRDVLVGLLAVRRGLIAADELDSVLLGATRQGAGPLSESLRQRLGADAWAELQQSADQQLSDAGSIPAAEIPPPHPGATVIETIPPSSASPAEVRTQGPRYSRTRKHAEGGLGVIYGAWDEELGREVALKEIKERHADRPGSRARFVFEAEVTGRLEHPGVVPVYGLGVYPDGRPYYAMRFIKGQSMQEALERFHEADRGKRQPGERALALRALLNRFVAVCNAIAYAHSKGVIHRDLKPANVMLGEYGETLVVDWGLAKAVGGPEQKSLVSSFSHGPSLGSELFQAETARAGGTEQGAIVGTPNYMPPEQATGDAEQVGPHSDVYSLGATLYHLITGKMAVDEPALERTLEKVVRGEVTPARRVNAKVPAALEAVCARAMAVAPGDRYESAAALAAEVERFLADEPVLAYPEPIPARMVRWARRNRTLVSSAVVLLLAGVVGLSVGLWAVDRERQQTVRQRDEAEENLRRAVAAEEATKRERDRALAAEKQANKNLELARKAVNECFGIAKKHPLLQEPGAQPVKKLLLETTARFYRDFRAQRPDDPRLAFEQAEYLVRVGYVTSQIGSKTEALKSYLEALDELRKLHRAHPKEREYLESLASACNDAAMVLVEVGRFAEARRTALEARGHFAALRDAHPEEVDYAEGQAVAIQNLGVIVAQTDPVKGLAHSEEALRLYLALSRKDPDNEEFALDVADAANNVGKQKMEAGDLESARTLFEKSLAFYRKMAARYPRSAGYRKRLAEASSNVGLLFALAVGKQKEAAEHLEAARELFLALSKEHPDVTEYKAGLARTYARAYLEQQQGKSAEATRSYALARDALKKLVEEHPDVVRYRFELALTCNDAGEVYRQAGQWDQALKLFGEAADALRALLRDHPDAAGPRTMLGTSLNNVALIHLQQSRLAEAEKAFAESIEQLEAVLRDRPEEYQARLSLTLATNNIAYLRAARGRPKDALEYSTAAVQKGEALRAAAPGMHAANYVASLAYFNQGRALLMLGRHEESLKSYHKGLGISRRLLRTHPGVSEYRSMHAMGCCFRGLVLNLLGNPDAARRDAAEARDLLGPLHKEQPQLVQQTFVLGVACYVLGLTTTYLGDAPAGMKYSQEALDLLGPLVEAHPGNPEYAAGLAMANVGLGASCMEVQRFADAARHLGEARRLSRGLVKGQPQNLDYNLMLAQSCFMLGLVHVASNQAAEARKCGEEARPVLERMIQAQPKNAQYVVLLAVVDLIRGLALAMQEDAAGPKLIGQSRDRLLELDKKGVVAPPQRIFAVIASKVLGLLAQEARRYEEAVGHYEQALAVLGSLVKTLPKVPVYRQQFFDVALRACDCHDALKKPAGALEILRQAREHARRLRADFPSSASDFQLGAVDLRLAKALTPKEALPILDEAIEVLAKLCKAEPKRKDYQEPHKQARLMRAYALHQAGRPLDGVADVDEVLEGEADSTVCLGLRSVRADLFLAGHDPRRFAEAIDQMCRDKAFPAAAALQLARWLAENCEAIRLDRTRPLPQREKDGERHARQVLDLLRRYERAGLLDEQGLKVVKTDAAFRAMRSRADFQRWLKGVEEGRKG